MKRLVLFLVILCLSVGIGAEEMKIGTIQPTAVFGPLFVKVLKDAGIDATIVAYNAQPELYAALAKNEIDGAFFIAQPIIARIPGAVMVSARISQTDFYGVSLDPSIKANNPGELRKYSVGIVKDNEAHVAITRGIKAIETQNDRELFAGLGAGNYQMIISVDKLVPIMSRATGIGQCYMGDRPLLRTPTFLALSASNADKKDKLEGVFGQWLRTGKWGSEMGKLAR